MSENSPTGSLLALACFGYLYFCIWLAGSADNIIFEVIQMQNTVFPLLLAYCIGILPILFIELVFEDEAVTIVVALYTASFGFALRNNMLGERFPEWFGFLILTYGASVVIISIIAIYVSLLGGLFTALFGKNLRTGYRTLSFFFYKILSSVISPVLFITSLSRRFVLLLLLLGSLGLSFVSIQTVGQIKNGLSLLLFIIGIQLSLIEISHAQSDSRLINDPHFEQSIQNGAKAWVRMSRIKRICYEYFSLAKRVFVRTPRLVGRKMIRIPACIFSWIRSILSGIWGAVRRS